MAHIDDPPDSAAAARDAGLRYVTARTPGIGRRRAGTGFSYRTAAGEPVTAKQRERIDGLVIPPAWTDVWISPLANGHVQATGRDARGRKQYVYHPRWREVRDATKYGRTVAFGRSLAAVRRRIDRDLARSGLPREKVLAAVLRLIDTTLMRVGNDEYARLNESFGATTIRSEHASVRRERVRFEYVGKAGKEHSVTIDDRRLARIVKRCQELEGEELFCYVDDGVTRDVGSSDVNAYLREIAGEEFSVKDFRTWGGTVHAMQTLWSIGPPDSEGDARRKLTHAFRLVAAELGNTPAVCRACYVHPAVIEAYRNGSLPERPPTSASPRQRGLRDDEAVLLSFLEECGQQAAAA